MSDARIEYDEIVKMLNRLHNDEVKGILLTATKTAADALRDRTREILLRKVPMAGIKKRYEKKMVEGIRSKADKDYTLSYVTIMKEFRLKFFELGTKLRYRKVRYKGKDKLGRTRQVLKKDDLKASTGRIKPLNFFLQARQQYSNQICDDMERTILQSLERITGNLK